MTSDYHARQRILRTSHKRSSTPKGEEADTAISCSMASTVLPHCPSSRLPHPPLPDPLLADFWVLKVTQRYSEGVFFVLIKLTEPLTALLFLTRFLRRKNCTAPRFVPTRLMYGWKRMATRFNINVNFRSAYLTSRGARGWWTCQLVVRGKLEVCVPLLSSSLARRVT